MTNIVTECAYLGTATRACGCPTLEGKSYCEEHMWLVYQKGTARARRKKDEKTAALVWNIEDAFNEAVKQLEEEGYDFADPRWEVKELDLD
jgi:hypothetical protein